MLREISAREDILIVEDNEVNATILRTMLRRHGYEPRMASDGAMGVAMSTRYQPKLVLMDLHMPHLDGFAAARKIRRAMNGHSPVLVAVTATSACEVETACSDAGFASILAKPILLSDLLATVRRYLD